MKHTNSNIKQLHLYEINSCKCIVEVIRASEYLHLTLYSLGNCDNWARAYMSHSGRTHNIKNFYITSKRLVYEKY